MATVKTFYNEHGKEVTSEDNVFAIKKETDAMNVFYCLANRGRLVNPANRIKQDREKLITVTESSFNKYVLFLQKRDLALLSIANRER